MRDLKRRELEELISRVFNMSKEEIRQLVMYNYYGKHVKNNQKKLESIKEFFKTHIGMDVKIIQKEKKVVPEKTRFKTIFIPKICRVINVYPSWVLLEDLEKSKKISITYVDFLTKDYLYEEVAESEIYSYA